MLSFHNSNSRKFQTITILLFLLGLCVLPSVLQCQFRLNQINTIFSRQIRYQTADHMDKMYCKSLSIPLNSSEPKLLINNQFFLRYFAEQSKIDGWLTSETWYVIWLFIQFQYKHQIVDRAIGEIGVHRGKLTIYLYLLRHRSKKQKLFAVDVFSYKALNFDASGDGDRLEFLQNVKRYANVSADEIILYEGSSLDLNSVLTHNSKSESWWLEQLGKKSCQLVSIDGGHSNLLTYSDICLISNSLTDGGIVVVDDIENSKWVGVRDGVGQFLAETSMIFNGNDDPELANALNKRLTTPNFNLSCRIVDATRKITNLNHKCSRLVPVLQYANKLYLTTPNYYPHYIDLLKKLNDKGINFIHYDTLRSTAGNVPIWSGSGPKHYDVFNKIVQPDWLSELAQATK